MNPGLAKILTISASLLTCILVSTFGTPVNASDRDGETSRFGFNLTESRQAKRLFEIPVYPGTIPFNGTPRFQRLQPPFATSMFVYRTADGRDLDKEKVITFYNSYLTSRGWKEDIFRRQGEEAYLGMSVDVFEQFPENSRIQLSGKFYLWVSPKDGVYTMLLDQWRISSLGQSKINYLAKVAGALDSIGTRHGYIVQKVSTDGEWSRDYENEFLIDRARYSFISKEAKGPHPGEGQHISLFILTYPDLAIAEEEARRHRPNPMDTRNGDQVLILPSRGITVVVVKNHTVFLIRDLSGAQRDAVTGIAAELDKL